jgi:hypothetical protein
MDESPSVFLGFGFAFTFVMISEKEQQLKSDRIPCHARENLLQTPVHDGEKKVKKLGKHVTAGKKTRSIV